MTPVSLSVDACMAFNYEFCVYMKFASNVMCFVKAYYMNEHV